MKRLLRTLLVAALVLVVLLAAALAWIARPPARRAPPAVTAERSAAHVERGRYLARHVTGCVQCHSQVHEERFSLPVRLGTEGGGGDAYSRDVGLHAPNITPDHAAGLGAWSDGEILRAIREGVSRDGTALFPLMPYPSFRAMSDDDALAVVAYLRTMSPIGTPRPPRELRFPLGLVARRAAEPLDGPVAGPAPDADPVEKGRYLATIAGCRDCHTPMGRGGRDATRELQGGWEMVGPWGRVVTPNITPHPTTWVGAADLTTFIRRFKQLGLSTSSLPPATAPGANSPMPWHAYSGMTVEDLTALHAYLKSVPPVEHATVTFPDLAAQQAP